MTITDDPPSRTPTPPNPPLPPLTKAVIARARDGLAAARDQRARAGTEASLHNIEVGLDGGKERRISGALRRRLARILIYALFRVRLQQPENIPTGPVMLAPNHLNHIDPFFVLSQMPAVPYYYVLGDARTLYNKPWKRWLIQWVGGVIPLDRLWKEEMAVMAAAKDGHPELAELAAAIEHDVSDGGSMNALRRLDGIIQRIFERGDSLLIFPEGGLAAQEGHLRLPLKRGAVIYAMRAGIPIVPVGLVGNRDLFFRKQLTIRFGPPLDFGQSHRPKPREVQANLAILENAIDALLEPNYQEPTGWRPLRHLINHMFW